MYPASRSKFDTVALWSKRSIFQEGYHIRTNLFLEVSLIGQVEPPSLHEDHDDTHQDTDIAVVCCQWGVLQREHTEEKCRQTLSSDSGLYSTHIHVCYHAWLVKYGRYFNQLTGRKHWEIVSHCVHLHRTAVSRATSRVVYNLGNTCCSHAQVYTFHICIM